MRRPPAIEAARRDAFLAAYAELGTLTHAAAKAECSRSAHAYWMKDPDYREKFAQAQSQAVEKLERELFRRAAEGWEEPVFHKGEVVGSVRRYSDACLIFALKGLNRQKWSERITVVTEDAVDAEIRRLSAQLERDRTEVGEAAPTAEPPG